MTAEITLNNSTTPNAQEQHSASQSFNDTTAVGLPRATLRCIASFHLTGGKMANWSCRGFIGWAAGSLKATAGAHGHRGRVTAWREDIAIRPGRAKPPTGFGLDWFFFRLKTRGEGQARSHENKSDMNGVSLLVVGHHQHRSRTVNESRLGRSISFSSKATVLTHFCFISLNVITTHLNHCEAKLE